MSIDIEIPTYLSCTSSDNLAKNKHTCNFRFYLNKSSYKATVNGLKTLASEYQGWFGEIDFQSHKPLIIVLIFICLFNSLLICIIDL